MILVLVRHGQSEANLHTYYTGQMDVPLTEFGRQQAAAIRPILRQFSFDKIYSSDLQRASSTCEVAADGAAYEVTKLLREYDVGSLEGIELSKSPLRRDGVPQYPDYTPYGGENVTMVRRRAREFLSMLEKSDYRYVAAFSHFGFINCIFKELLDANYRSGVIKTENCAVHVLEFDGEKWRIAALNYMTPLA
jgi:probable phosphoglycerate mutase